MSTDTTTANIDFRATDRDGDSLTVKPYLASADAPGELHVWTPGTSGMYLSPVETLELYHALGDHLMATTPVAPDATVDGYDWPAGACDPECTAPHVPDLDLAGYESVAHEAHEAVYGDREDDYGHPREDFTRTAILWTGLLQHKLADGAYIDAEDIARCQIGVKLARDVNSPKRDNRVDMAGYAITLDRLETGK